MYIREWDEFWWRNITGPQKAVSEVATALSSNSNVVLVVPADLPWRHSMRSAIEEQFRNELGSSNTIITQIDAADDCPADVDPGRFLLQRFAKDDIGRNYRERSGATLQTYMIQNKVLWNSIIWIKGLDKEQTKKWLKFCQGYKGKSIEDGLFVLETHTQLAPPEVKSLKKIDFEECVREYDLQLFNSFILDAQGSSRDHWKKYISTLAASLCQTDAEVSEQYIQETDFFNEEPLTGIGRIAEYPEFARRGEDPDSTHVLSLWRSGNLEELNKRVWEAQLQVLFPMIEKHRMKIIQELEESIKVCLETHDVLQFGQRISEPFDAEFGALEFMMAKHDEYGMRWLSVPDETVRNRIHLLRACRNNLAHSDCCTVEQVKELMFM